MTSRIAVLGTVLLTALLLQTVVMAPVSIAGWRPDIVVLTVIAIALADGPDSGARYGFVAGLMADLLASSSGLVGLTALVFLLVGDLVGRLRVYLTGMAWVGEAALAAAATAGAFLAFGLLAMLLDLQQFTIPLVAEMVVIQAIWSLLLAPLVLRPLRALSRRFPGAEALSAGGAATLT